MRFIVLHATGNQPAQRLTDKGDEMGKKLELYPGENILVDTKRSTLQGKKVKFPVYSRCVLTDQRFVYFDLGKMAPFHMQLGILIMLLVKGNPVSFPLEGLRACRGKYARNKKLLELKAIDGSVVLLNSFEKSLEWFRDSLLSNGIGLSQAGEEEWQVTP
ncbi:hypothetical protein DRQ25_11045 [Candidatus Fermentibacteria bacterium]|nr:MAG: hypothetical protein DRQ25_11045 [Candidatus Fermentibacteria bacterium]